MPAKRTKMSDCVRAEIERSKFSRYRIAKETGIGESTLSRFMASETGLSMDALDALFQFFELEVVPKRRKRS
jgi:transcriptional regulator with XRE-family HTH domain